MTVASPEAHRKYAGSLLTVTRSARKPAERPVTWLTLVYRVPSEPTRHRAAVWRRLRTMGAVYVQNSVAVLPRSPERERALRTLRNEIVEKMEGKAYLLTSTALAGETDLVATVNAARDDEYEEHDEQDDGDDELCVFEQVVLEVSAEPACAGCEDVLIG